MKKKLLFLALIISFSSPCIHTMEKSINPTEPLFAQRGASWGSSFTHQIPFGTALRTAAALQSPNTPYWKRMEAKSPLFGAVIKEDIEQVKKLLQEGADPNPTTEEGTKDISS